MKYVLPLFLFFVAPAFAENSVQHVSKYFGSYVLTNDRLGLCAPDIRVWSSDGSDGDSFQMWVGDYFFRSVNGGTQRFDNDFEKGSFVSRYENNTLSFNRQWFHKIKRVHERQRIVARFNGETVRVTSNLWGAPPTERDCRYRRVKGETPNFGD